MQEFPLILSLVVYFEYFTHTLQIESIRIKEDSMLQGVYISMSALCPRNFTYMYKVSIFLPALKSFHTVT